MKINYIYNDSIKAVEELIIHGNMITFGENKYELVSQISDCAFIVKGTNPKVNCIAFHDRTMTTRTNAKIIKSYPIMPVSYVPDQPLVHNITFRMNNVNTGFICSKKPLLALEKDDLLTHSGSAEWHIGDSLMTVEVEKTSRTNNSIILRGQEKDEKIELIIAEGKIVVVIDYEGNAYPVIN